MKFQNNTALPYPVIAEGRDDYIDSSYTVRIYKSIDSQRVRISLEHDVSVYKIEKLINNSENNELSFLTIVECRSTFYKEAFFSQDAKQHIYINTLDLRDDVYIQTYIVARENVTFEYINLNEEYGADKVSYNQGDIVAIGPTDAFAVDPDMFKPLQSVIKITLVEDLEDGDWEIDTGQDLLVIRTSKSVHDFEAEMQNSKNGQLILANSIFYTAISEGIQAIKDKSVSEDSKWVKAMSNMFKNRSISDQEIKDQVAYKITNKLMLYPLKSFKEFGSEV